MTGGSEGVAAVSLVDSAKRLDSVDRNLVVNVPGAGGTVGLAQFVNTARGDGQQLLTMGITMVGAVLTNKSPVGLDAVTPIAASSMRLAAKAGVCQVDGPSTPTTACSQSSSATRRLRAARAGSRSSSTRDAIAPAAAAMLFALGLFLASTVRSSASPTTLFVQRLWLVNAMR